VARVRLLDERIANHIAAGEVIERPASVVKELIENALDAGATRIEVTVEGAGRQRLRVRDDGSGMSREDAVLALQRHATSKIASLEDLRAIATLGFRGEALPSIAAVSHLQVLTRLPDEDTGTLVRAEGGTVVSVTPAGAPPGTEVAVSRLFYNTPARWKFLKTDHTEVRHIAEVVSRFTLSHPECDWLLLIEGREVFVRPATDSLAAVLRVLGGEFADALAPVDLRVPAGHVTGFIARPDLSRAARAQQYLFANRRAIRSRALTIAAEEAYGGLLHGARYPVFVLSIAVPPEEVDVNVHPTKAEVRFVREREIFAAVRRAVQEALAGARLAPALSLAARHALPNAPLPPMTAVPAGFRVQPPLPATDGDENGAALRLRPLAQLRSTYLLVESGEGLLIVNQHRAHERVLYDRLIATDLDRPGAQQALTLPPTLHLTPDEAAALAARLAVFASLGFTLEPFGANSFLLRTVPAALARLDAVQLVRDLLEELMSSPAGEVDAPSGARQAREHLLETMACRSAIRAGDALTPEEMRHLLGDLERCATPAICPHGQPIIFSITHAELDRRFQR